MISVILATVLAALPPLAQSIREIQTMVGDSELYTRLGSGETIQDIVRTESGYIVRTSHYLLHVDVEYKMAKHPGPTPFQLRFHDPISLAIHEAREHPGEAVGDDFNGDRRQ